MIIDVALPGNTTVIKHHIPDWGLIPPKQREHIIQTIDKPPTNVIPYDQTIRDNPK